MEPKGVLILDEACLLIVERYFLYILCRNLSHSIWENKWAVSLPLVLAKDATPQVRKTKLVRRIIWFIGLVFPLRAGQKSFGCYPLI